MLKFETTVKTDLALRFLEGFLNNDLDLYDEVEVNAYYKIADVDEKKARLRIKAKSIDDLESIKKMIPIYED